MDLSSATSSQQQIITTLDAPLSVSAGAGSGKTFTLTNRIGYALVGEAGVSSTFIDSIDEVLATTFSKSGAAEMKSRVRSLRRRLRRQSGYTEHESSFVLLRVPMQ